MADPRYMQDYSQRNSAEERRTASATHPYRPAVDEGQRQPDANMAASVSLPSIHDPRAGSYAQQPPQHQAQGHPPQGAPARGYPPDPRYASPTAANGYPPPGAQQQAPPPPPPPPPQHHQSGYLPPLQQQQDPRSQGYPSQPPADHRGGPYYDDRRPPYQHEQYPPDSYYYRGPPPGQGQQPPPNGYPRDYRGPPPGPYAEYAQAPGAPPMAQAAPRQRTSIACRYCRKRKIRCSGYQSAPGGKCQNCARMNQECIFQPVSSSSSAAFIPVSAVPGGVPPGTQLFGAYGQPLNPAGVQGPPPQYPPPVGGPPPGAFYQQPLHSPAESFASYGDPRGEEAQMAGRRRRRTPEEQDESYRLPPPRSAVSEEEHRRRSPAEFSNHSSPLNPPQQPSMPAGQHPSGHQGDNRSPIAQGASSGSSTPARPGAAPTSQPQQGGSSKMSLSNLVDIDRTMIDRLNRPRDASGTQSSARSDGGR